MKKIIILITILLLSILIRASSQIEELGKSISISEIQDCKTVYWNETIDIIGTCTLNYTITKECDSKTKGFYFVAENNTYYCDVIGYYNYSCKTGEKIIELNKQICEKPQYTVLINNENKTIINEWNCNLSTLICDSCRDGNCDGIVQSGESYCDLKKGTCRLDEKYAVFENQTILSSGTYDIINDVIIK